MIVCPTCGTENPDTAKFCSECGARLKPAEPAAPPPPPAMPTADEPADSAAGAEPTDEAERPKKDASGLPPAWMPPPVTLQSRPSGQITPPPARPAPSEPIVTPTSPAEAGPPEPETPPSASAVSGKDDSGLPPVWMPPPVTPSFQGGETAGGGAGGNGEWRMSSLGPVPERKNRRLWLWIPVGLMTAVVICCIAVFIWASTIGSDTVDRWATEGAIERTEEALSGD